MDSLQYPVGRFQPRPSLTPAEREALITDIEGLPAALIAAVAPLADAQLDTAYRPGGWTVRQLVHHLPDSHLNAYARFKLALTEQAPTIKPYDQDAWAHLPDSQAEVQPSLLMLSGLHRRWVLLLRSMSGADWRRKLVHPENGELDLDRMLQLYAWHSRHHLAHITRLVARSGWASPLARD